MTRPFDDAVPAARAAEDVVLAYHRAIDTGCALEAVGLFSDDAVFQAKGVELVGRDAITGFLADRQAQTGRHTVHVVANVSVVREDRDEVELRAFILLHVLQPDGRYDLERVLDTTHVIGRSAAGWRVQRRSSQPLHALQPRAA